MSRAEAETRRTRGRRDSPEWRAASDGNAERRMIDRGFEDQDQRPRPDLYPPLDGHRRRSSDTTRDPSQEELRHFRESGRSPNDRRRFTRTYDFTYSPPNMYHSFQQERRASSPAPRERRESYFDRPAARGRQYDRYVPRRRSPVRHGRRSTSRASSPPVSPRSSQGSKEQDASEPAQYRNLTWMKPPSSPQSTSKPKINVNGIKGVPTGPSNWIYPPVDASLKSLPHIFVSSKHVPAVPTTVQHLARIVRRYSPHDVVMDDTGYYIAFPDNEGGLLGLEACYKSNPDTKIFSQYPLVMQVFQNGVTNSNYHRSSGGGPEEAANRMLSDVRPLSLEQSAVDRNLHMGAFSNQEPSYSDAALTHQLNVSQNTDPQQNNQDAALATSGPMQPVGDNGREANAIRPMSRLSTLPGNSRQDKDETASSISGQTVSDVSGSGMRSCHVCKVKADVDHLMKCTTCTRRYHRHCHSSKPGPIMNEDDWQCQRCGRKGVALKRAASELSESETRSHGGSVDADNNPLFKKRRLEGETGNAGDVWSTQSATSTVMRPTADPHLVPVRDSNEIQGSEGITIDGTDSNANVGAGQVNGHQKPSDGEIFEADDLVERSFTSTEASASVAREHLQKGVVKVKMTKRQLPWEERRTLSAHSNEEPSIPAVHKNHDMIDPITSEDVARSAQSSVDLHNTTGKGHTTNTVPSNSEIPETQAERREKSRSQHLERLITSKTAAGKVASHKHSASASPVDSVVQPTRSKPTLQKSVKCSECHIRQVPRHPTGRSVCSLCKAARAKAAASGKTPDRLQNDTTDQRRSEERPHPPSAVNPNSEENRHISIQPPHSSASEAIPHSPPPQVEQNHDSEESRPLRKLREKQPPHSLPGNDLDVSFERRTSRRFPLDVTPSQGNESQESEMATRMSTRRGRREQQEREKERPHRNAPRSQAVAAPPVSPNSPNKRIKRQSQRTDPVNQFDLGDSNGRPKGTYERLMALALSDTPEGRLQPAGFTRWVEDHVPGYQIKEGKWASGLKATLIMNVKGDVGRPMARRVEWQEGDPGQPGSDWYVLLPGLRDTLEHWDHDMKRPLPPPATKSQSQPNTVETEMGDEGDVDRQHTLRAPANETYHSKHQNARRKRSKRNLVSEMVDTSDFDSSDEEPLALVQKRNLTTRIASMDATSAMPTGDNASNPIDIDQTSPRIPPDLVQDTTIQISDSSTPNMAIGKSADRDNERLRELIIQEVKSHAFSGGSLLDTWPEYHPGNRSHQVTSMEEIRARPTRKQMFGKPATQSRLGNVEIPTTIHPDDLSSFVIKQQYKTSPDDMVDDNTVLRPCKTLDEFLGTSDDLVPVLHDRQLAFRHVDSRSRIIYRTNI